jgi:hypothetical protein
MAALIAAAALALQTTLRRPTSADALALRVISELQHIGSISSDLSLSSVPSVRARCSSRGKRDMVILSDGSRLVVDPAGVRQRRGEWRRPILVDAEARLAACPRLLVGDLSRRLFAGKRVIDGNLIFDGALAYRVRVDTQQPTVFLIVSRRDLTPLAVRLRSGGGVRGASRVIDVRLAGGGLNDSVVAGSLARAHPAR